MLTGETPYDVAENYHVIKQYLLPLQFKYMNNEVTTPTPPAYGMQNHTNNGYIPQNQPMNYDESSNNMALNSNSTDNFNDPPTMFVDPKLLNSYRVSPSNSSNNIAAAHQPPPPPPTSFATTPVVENIVETSKIPVVKKVAPPVAIPASNTIKKAEIVKNSVFNNSLVQPSIAPTNNKPANEDRVQGKGPLEQKIPVITPAVPTHTTPFIPATPTHNIAPTAVSTHHAVPPAVPIHSTGPVNTGPKFIPSVSTHHAVPPAVPVNAGGPFIPSGVPPVPVGTNVMIPNGNVSTNPPVVPAVVHAPKIITKTIVPANDGFYSSTTDPQLQAKYGHNIEIKRTGIHSFTHLSTQSRTHSLARSTTTYYISIYTSTV